MAIAILCVFGALNLTGADRMSATGDFRLPEKAFVVADTPGYNSWPMIQAMGGKLVCSYSRDNARPKDGHRIDPGSRDSYVRVSSDGGRTWSPERTVAADPEIGEVNEGIGLDSAGAALLWVRCWGKGRRHELYRTVDGVKLEKIASLTPDPFPMQVMDPVAVRGLGLVSPWFAGSYRKGGSNSWGILVSADDGRTWTQRVIEDGLSVKEWVTEPSLVDLGGGRLLIVGRCEQNLGNQFQVTSTDNGRTWKKARTNIDDVRESTPSLVYDRETGLIANYYYHRGARQLKRRVVAADFIFDRPDAWPEPEVLDRGFETRPHDAGNVKTTRFGATDCCAWYSGTPSNSTVVVTVVPKPKVAGISGAVGASFGATAQYTETETETEEVVAKAADDASKIVKFTEGTDWAPLDYRRNIEKGSALDFSTMPYFRGPAGAFGPVVVRSGHFEFEKLPGVPQRFYGANLCGSACFLDHALADEVAERFARMGFNSVRIHHHDGPCSKPGTGSEVALIPEMMDKLDYLVAALVKRGIYLETDLYVSRHASWRALGIDRDGDAERYSRKALMTFYPPAYSNWCSFARAFLTHRNPYTGRTYAEEPAWVGIGLINEGRFVFPFPTLPTLEPFQAKWREWIKAKRAADPDCYPELGKKIGKYPKVEWKDQKEMTLPQVCCDFSADLEREFFLKARKFLRDELGCRAPLSNNNNSEPYAAMELVRDEIYDFCDTHDYFGGSAKTKPPISTCNTNVFLAWNKLTGRTPWLRIFDKPVVVTEMNFPHPNPHRGGGLLTAGAIAAFQDYGAIWHFAYSHGDKKLLDRPYEGKSRFDLAADPLNALGVKLPFALFCRGDLEPARERCVLAIDEAAVHPKHGFGQYVYPPKWGREAAWLMRAGCCAAGRAPKDAKVFPLMDVVDLDAPPYRPAPEKALAFDGTRGSLVVDTPQTAAGYVPEGTLVAGPFRAAFGRDFGTAAAIALDAQPLAQSARLLVLVLADVQFDGATYTDASRTSQLEKGTYAKPIVKVMRVPVRLDLASAADYAVYALDTAGRRTGTVEATVRDGALAFVASTCGPDGKGCLAWEVVRK